ncbi:MAG: hypothetical protein ABGW49_02610 [Nitrosopumilus sp.]|jgi:hypothetical protein
MKKNTLLVMTLISCVVVVLAVITQDDEEVIIQDVEETTTQDNVGTTDVNDSNEQITEFELDKQRVEELQLQYDEIIEYSCMDAKPQSYFEIKLKEGILEAEHRLRYLAEQQSEMENIINQVVVLNEKYSESGKQAFMFYEWECVNQKFWVEEYPHLQDILNTD